MESKSEIKPDFRAPTASKKPARGVADGVAGVVIAVADIDAQPERVFRALTTNEAERWWGHADFYRMERWTADLRVCGPWSVTVRFPDGNVVHADGEFAALEEPRSIVMTRRFDKHPLLGTRETTIAYRLEPVASGTRLTVREEGFVGRSAAAHGNAEHWERVLAWLGEYLRAEPG
jgi:uncharacterized protein YndB with AHSA1/START domain